MIFCLSSLTDPLRYERQVISFDPVSGFPTKSVGVCVNDSALPYLIPLLVFVFATLILGNVFAFRGRNVPVLFNEGKYIGFSLINFLECFALCVPIMIITQKFPVVDALVKSLFVLMCTGKKDGVTS